MPPTLVQVTEAVHIRNATRFCTWTHVATDLSLATGQTIRATGRIRIAPTADRTGAAALDAEAVAASGLGVRLEISLAVSAELATLAGIAIPVLSARSGWIVVRATVPTGGAVAHGEVVAWVTGEVAHLVSQTLAAPARTANMTPATLVWVSLADTLIGIGADTAAIATDEVVVAVSAAPILVRALDSVHALPTLTTLPCATGVTTGSAVGLVELSIDAEVATLGVPASGASAGPALTREIPLTGGATGSAVVIIVLEVDTIPAALCVRRIVAPARPAQAGQVTLTGLTAAATMRLIAHGINTLPVTAHLTCRTGGGR